MEPNGNCPTDSFLAQLLSDEVPPGEADAALEHLSGCENCQRRAEILTGQAAACLGSSLSNLERGDSDRQSAALRQALEQAKAASLSQDADVHELVAELLPWTQSTHRSTQDLRLGPYEIIGLLGRGGMGAVLQVRDPVLQRHAAVKILLPQIAVSRQARQRFLREARAAAAISHEAVVTIFAVDEAHGYPYLVMEYVAGRTLQHLLSERGTLLPHEIAAIGSQIAEGLAAAHSHGVIHRDIKPSNVLIKASDQRIKLSDFGLALIADELQLTQPGMIAGTPAYMSPEQAQGQTVDDRSDLFSLGSVLYALATGRSPFEGRSTADTLRRLCDAERVSMSAVAGSVPAGLRTVIEQLLAKDPRERFQTAAEAAAALRACRASSDQPTLVAKGNWALGTVREEPFTGASHATGPKSPSATNLAESLSIAVLPFSNLTSDPENEYFSEGLAEDLINALTRVNGLSVVARSSAFQFKGQHLDVREIGSRLNVRYILEGSVRKAGHRIRISAQLVDVVSGYHLWSERYDRDLEDIFAVQDDITQTIVEELKGRLVTSGELPRIKRQTADIDAYSRYLRGRFYWNKREPAALRRAVEFYDQALALDPNYAEALAGKADCAILLANYALADQTLALASARQCSERALQLDGSLAEAHKVMGFVLACADHAWEQAELHFQRAIETDPHAASVRMAYALALLLPLGRFEEASRQAACAVELDPVTPMIVATPAVIATYCRKFEEAQRGFDEALELDPDNPVVNLWSCALWMETGEFERAMAAVQHARPFQLMAEETTGVILARAGRRTEALKYLEAMLSQADQGRREASLSVARIYAALDQPDQALLWLDRAIANRVVASVLLKVDPCYDGLRKHPRFQALLKSLNLDSWDAN